MLSVLAAMFIGMSLGHAQTSGAHEAVPGEYIVKLKSMVGPSGIVSKMQNKMVMKASFPGLNMYHVSLKIDRDAAKSLQDLSSDPDVEYVEPNYVLKKADFDENAGLGAPDKVYSLSEAQALEQVSTQSATYSQSGAQTRVADAWAIESNGPARPIVAIVDTGLDKTHDVFVNSQALWTNAREIANNGIDDDYNGYIDDINGWNFINDTNNFYDDDGHGTHVAGIIVGTSLNILASPVTETAKMRIMPLKFLDANGSGSTSNAIRAIYYAVNNGAQVINNSWGGPSYSRSLHEALAFAYNARVFIATAAGNNGKNNDTTPMYPASYDVPSNISVAATSDYDNLASFSNYGASTVHIGSPGVLILSTLPGNRIGSMSGTSMATPFISGLAALAMREAPYLTGYQIKNIMLNKAHNIVALMGKVSTSGRIDAYELITEAKLEAAVQPAQPSYSPGADRSIASSDDAPKPGSCGLVVSTAVLKGPGKGDGDLGGAAMLAGLMLIPIIVWTFLRQRALIASMATAADPAGRRRFERFRMDSDIRVTVGDRELVGSLKTISLGGASFCADEALEKGGIITMKITSPDGKDMVEVQGQVVWSEADQSYGVQFAGAEQGTLAMIQQWTKSLMKA
jgi:subtilisin family serine protease